MANNLGDSLGVVRDLRGARKLERIQLLGQTGLDEQGNARATYPYSVIAIPHGPPGGRAAEPFKLVGSPNGATASGAIAQPNSTAKVYVSCWSDRSIAVVDFAHAQQTVSYIPVGRHPTAMLWDGTRSRRRLPKSQ